MPIGTKVYLKVVALSGEAVSSSTIDSATTLSGSFPATVTVGCSTDDYTTLTACLVAIQAQGLSGNTVIELQSDYGGCGAETFPITFTNFSGLNTYKLTIRPTASATGLAITSAAASTFLLNGTQNIIFDGRPGGAGSARQLTIANTSTSGSTMVLRGGSHHCRLQYLNLTSVADAGLATVVLNAGASAGTSNNIFANNYFGQGATTPVCHLLATGTSAATNSADSLYKNQFANYWSNADTSVALRLGSYNSGWIIRGNSFYQTVTRNTNTASPLQHYSMFVQNPENASTFSVDSNYVCGTGIACSGSGGRMIIGGASAKVIRYTAMYIELGNTSGTAFYSINGNKIANIEVNSTKSTGLDLGGNLFTSIEFMNGSATGVLTIDKNQIGSADSGSSILLKSNKYVDVKGIVFKAKSLLPATLSNSEVGGITINLASGNYVSGFKGIDVNGGTVTVLGNLIGSRTVANSINNQSTSTLSLGNNATSGIDVEDLMGIILSTISYNTVTNITSANAGLLGSLVGINSGRTLGVYVVRLMGVATTSVSKVVVE